MTARARRSPAPRLAPSLALVDPPAPIPAPPPWVAESLAPKPRARDFTRASERIWNLDRFVERTIEADGFHLYRAYERADCFGYGVKIDELTYGRIDTRRPPSEGLGYDAAIDWEMARQAEVRDLIRQLCPETIADLEAGHRVYDGPGYVRVFRPEFRHAELAARRTP